MSPKVFTFLLALFCNFIASNAWSREIEVQLTYQVQWGNLDIGKAEAEWVFKEDTYTMSGASQTLGIVKKIREFRGASTLSGNIIEGAFQPVKLQITSISDEQKKQAETTWNPINGAIKTKRYPKIDKEKVLPLRQKLITSSIDPFSAMLNTLKKIQRIGRCEGNYRIYDGLRTAILSFHDMGVQHLIKDRPSAFGGSTIKCGVVSKPTGGHRIKNRWRKKNKEKDDVVGFISEVESGLFIPVRIEVATPIGKIISRLHMPSLIVTEL